MGKKEIEVHLIEKRIVGRKYASPGRARAAIGRSNLSKAEAKRLLALVDVWEMKPIEADWSETPNGLEGRRKPRITPPTVAAMEGGAVNGSTVPGRARLSTVFRAYRMLAELAEKEGATLIDLIGDVQSYELSVRSEVNRREGRRELQEVGPVAVGPDP